MKFNIDSLINEDLVALRKLFQAQGFDLRFVGGCVRDHLAGKTPKDLDLCTDANPDEQVAIYNQANIKHIPTGIDHGTITVVLNDVVYEITSLRLDVATDGRRATVAYTRDWVEDLARRDFTFNAMSFTFDGLLVDPFNGHSDLRNGIVRFVGDADQRIREDYLRILRYFRFMGRFGQGNVPYYNNDIVNNAQGLAQISKERVWSEIKQILAGPNAAKMMLAIHQHNCAEFIDLPREITWIMPAEELHASFLDPIAIMIYLYGAKTTKEVLKDWKTSREEQDYASYLSHVAMNVDHYDGYYELAVKGVRRDWVVNAAKMKNMDAFDIFMYEGWKIPDFPVNGYDLIKLGMKPGPQYSATIKTLKGEWAARGFKATKEELLALLNVNAIN